jgi:tetratricopeptide (TPR) repeat protein
MEVNEVRLLKCPSCGSTLDKNENKCSYCGNTFLISSYEELNNFSLGKTNKYIEAYKNVLIEKSDTGISYALGLCLLKMGLHEEAERTFQKVLQQEFNDSNLFFYLAICLLRGKKAFLSNKIVIDKAISYLVSAIMIYPKGIYYYLMAYLKYDYYFRKSLIINPNYMDDLNIAQKSIISKGEIEQLFTLLKVSEPSILVI